MFIKKLSNGYYKGSEQHSGKGLYLALFSWNPYKAADEIIAECLDCQCARKAYEFWLYHMHTYAAAQFGPECMNDWRAFITSKINALSYCDKHSTFSITGPRKLWATVRVTALHQIGHWMMGRIRIGGKSITVSGSIGYDGLPLDYQEVPKEYRYRLVEVPEEVAAAYWMDNGHNDIGSSRTVLEQWATKEFKL